MIVTCLRTTTKKNTGFALVFAMTAWPVRTLKHRGWLNAEMVYFRKATPEEVEYVTKSTRYVAYRYKKLRVLVDDEKKFGVDIIPLLPERYRRALESGDETAL